MKAHDTDSLRLTKTVEMNLQDCLVAEGSCLLYKPDPVRRHIEVEVRGQREKALISVQRVAYALAHPNEHVRADEVVTVLCTNIGNGHTGEGSCCAPSHMVKMDRTALAPTLPKVRQILTEATLLSVPIIGQPTIGDWFFTVQVICSCGKPAIMAGQPGTMKICPCKKAYRLMGMPTLDQAGNLHVPLAMGVAEASDIPPVQA